jgi:hypothetical protein
MGRGRKIIGVDQIRDGMVVRTVKEVAKLLKVSDVTVVKWKEKGMPWEKGQYDLDAIMAWRGIQKPVEVVSANKIDVMALAENTKMNVADIARVTGFNRQTVEKIVGDVRANRDLIEQYRSVREDFFAYEELQYLSHVTDEKLTNTAAKDLVSMAKTAYDKSRLEGGESTENVAVIVGAIKDWKKKRQELTQN